MEIVRILATSVISILSVCQPVYPFIYPRCFTLVFWHSSYIIFISFKNNFSKVVSLFPPKNLIIPLKNVRFHFPQKSRHAILRTSWTLLVVPSKTCIYLSIFFMYSCHKSSENERSLFHNCMVSWRTSVFFISQLKR